jgi:uncharacterized membrane protein
MTDQELGVVNRVLDTISSWAADIVNSYSTWMIASAVTWLVIGVIIILFGIIATVLSLKKDEPNGVYVFTAGAVLVFIGSLFVGANVPDLVSPKAAATHQLIKDIRGGSK